MNHFLTSNFAENQKIKLSNKEIDISELNYIFTESDLENDEILEIANDSIVDSNIDMLSDGIMGYEIKWTEEGVKQNIIDYIKTIFNENSLNYIDFEKFSKQQISDLIKFGYIDFYLNWNKKDKTLSEIVPLNQSLYSRDLNGLVTYNGVYLLENEENRIPQFIFNKYNVDSRNRYGKTTFNREMLNYVRFKKRLIILSDLAMDKASIPPSIITIDKETSQQYDTTDTDPTSTTGQAAFISYLDSLSGLLANLKSGSGVALAGVDKVESLKTNISPELFTKFKDMANEALAVGVIGTAVTTQEGDKGSYSSNEVANSSVIEPKKQKFARIVQRKINEIVKYCVMAKFQSRDLQSPYFVFDFTPKPSNEEIVNAFTAGLPIKKSSLPSYVYQDEDEKTEFIKKQEVQSVAFSEKKKTLRNTKVTF